MQRMTLLSSFVVFFILLTAVRYVDMPSEYVDRAYAPAEFSGQLNAAQLILIGEKLDINEASEEDLHVLRGIGPKLSARIVDDRERNGPFTSIYDLTRVHGIGPKTLAKNRHCLKITP